MIRTIQRFNCCNGLSDYQVDLPAASFEIAEKLVELSSKLVKQYGDGEWEGASRPFDDCNGHDAIEEGLCNRNTSPDAGCPVSNEQIGQTVMNNFELCDQSIDVMFMRDGTIMLMCQDEDSVESEVFSSFEDLEEAIKEQMAAWNGA